MIPQGPASEEGGQHPASMMGVDHAKMEVQKGSGKLPCDSDQSVFMESNKESGHPMGGLLAQQGDRNGVQRNTTEAPVVSGMVRSESERVREGHMPVPKANEMVKEQDEKMTHPECYARGMEAVSNTNTMIPMGGMLGESKESAEDGSGNGNGGTGEGQECSGGKNGAGQADQGQNDDDIRRANHNALERRRREYQKEKLQELKEFVPIISSDKPSTVEVLSKSAEYITSLTEKHDSQREKLLLLRKEINAIITEVYAKTGKNIDIPEDVQKAFDHIDNPNWKAYSKDVKECSVDDVNCGRAGNTGADLKSGNGGGREAKPKGKKLGKQQSDNGSASSGGSEKGSTNKKSKKRGMHNAVSRPLEDEVLEPNPDIERIIRNRANSLGMCADDDKEWTEGLFSGSADGDRKDNYTKTDGGRDESADGVSILKTMGKCGRRDRTKRKSESDSSSSTKRQYSSSRKSSKYDREAEIDLLQNFFEVARRTSLSTSDYEQFADMRIGEQYGHPGKSMHMEAGDDDVEVVDGVEKYLNIRKRPGAAAAESNAGKTTPSTSSSNPDESIVNSSNTNAQYQPHPGSAYHHPYAYNPYHPSMGPPHPGYQHSHMMAYGPGSSGVAPAPMYSYQHPPNPYGANHGAAVPTGPWKAPSAGAETKDSASTGRDCEMRNADSAASEAASLPGGDDAKSENKPSESVKKEGENGQASIPVTSRPGYGYPVPTGYPAWSQPPQYGHYPNGYYQPSGYGQQNSNGLPGPQISNHPHPIPPSEPYHQQQTPHVPYFVPSASHQANFTNQHAPHSHPEGEDAPTGSAGLTKESVQGTAPVPSGAELPASCEPDTTGKNPNPGAFYGASTSMGAHACEASDEPNVTGAASENVAMDGKAIEKNVEVEKIKIAPNASGVMLSEEEESALRSVCKEVVESIAETSAKQNAQRLMKA
eukprot:Nk52_evm12s250 gene=Nk52_evmTU12s250